MMRQVIFASCTMVALMFAGSALAARHHEGGHGHGQEIGQVMEHEHHNHNSWVGPPPEYAEKVSHRWADLEAIQRGETIYQKQCVSCHGVNGDGTGPIAPSLAHRPANLNNHFHSQPGSGDAYLFWRVSEGGAVEPFRSQNSSMPPFKSVLSEDERWDVLAYVHTFFHEGLVEWLRPD